MPQPIHKLDDGVQEYFEFEIKGHRYQFRHMTLDELKHLQEIEKKDEESREYLYSFITSVDEKSPAFPEIAKTLLTPHWIKFRKMVESEFSGNASR
jgi:hypothetical protein